MLRINSVIHDGNEISLLPENLDFEGNNTYTVIIGKNGVGKSRLLSEIVKTRIGTAHNTKHFHLRNSQSKFYYGALVVAVSTSPFDRFPSQRVKRSPLHTQYRYVGMRGEGMFSAPSAISLISSASKGLLDKTIRGVNSANFYEVFSSLSFEPSVNFVFKPNFEKKDARRGDERRSDRYFSASSPDGLDNYAVDLRYKHIYDRLEEAEKEEIFFAMNSISEYLEDTKAISLKIDFASNKFYLAERPASPQIIYSLKFLLDKNLVRIMDLRLIKDTYGELNLRTASSGEQCLMVMMLGIAGHIEDGSLILIDEPEISLHPRWQENFMSLLSKAFSKYRDCHFIIATHSPQIVSRMNDANSYICSLTQQRLYSARDFNKKSADYQLAELFDAPGLMNEYIARLCFNLIAKLKTHKKTSSELAADLNKLLELKSKIQDTDPTVELINSASALFDHYASNQ